jgi:hypothetical protein
MMLPFLIAWLVSRINRYQDRVIRYLREENRLLKARIKGKRMQLTDTDRRRLAVLAHPIERKQLQGLSTIATPDILRRWHRRLVEQAPSVTPPGKRFGRPRVNEGIEQLVIRMATENPRWGYRRIQGSLSNLGHHIHNTTVCSILRRNHLDPVPIRGKASVCWVQCIKLHLEVLAATGFFEARRSLMTGCWTVVTQRGWRLNVKGSQLLGWLCHSLLRVPALAAQQWRAHWSACLKDGDIRYCFVFSWRQLGMTESHHAASFVPSLPLPSQGQTSPIEYKRAPPYAASIDLMLVSRRVCGQRGRARLCLVLSTRHKGQSDTISDESRRQPSLADSDALAA